MKRKIAETYLKMPSVGYRVGFYTGTGSDKKFDCFPEIDEVAFETEDEAWQWANGFAFKAPPQYVRIHVVGPGSFTATKRSATETKRLPPIPNISGVNLPPTAAPTPTGITTPGAMSTNPQRPDFTTEKKIS